MSKPLAADLQRHVERLATVPRPPGSAEHTQAQAYLTRISERLGPEKGLLKHYAARRAELVPAEAERITTMNTRPRTSDPRTRSRKPGPVGPRLRLEVLESRLTPAVTGGRQSRPPSHGTPH